MTMLNMIRDRFPEAMIIDGFDDAIVGVLVRHGKVPLVVYETERLIEIVERDGVSNEEAMEHVSFNILSAYFGERTPLYITVDNQVEVDLSCG